MTLKTRRFLFLIFLLIFIIITPLISLYATGYTVGNGFKIQKTGILIINSEPKGAKIFINNKIQQKFFSKLFNKNEGYVKTPAKIKNIKPGEYKVRLEIQGYWTWEKKIEIKPGQSTFYENIVLFKQDLPLKMIDGEFTNIKLSPNKKFLIAQQANKDHLINLDNEEITSINLATTTFKNTCSWSPDNQEFLLNNQLYETTDTDSPTKLKDLMGNKPTKVKWDINNDNKLYYSYDNTIACFNLSSEQNEVILKNKIIDDYFSQDEHLFYIEKYNNQSILHIYNIPQKENIKSINLPNSDYKFLNESHKFINLYDTKYHILYIIDPFSSIRPLYDTINNVTETFWVNNDILLFANDFEIWTYSLSDQNKKLITRISDKIKTIFWNYKKGYIIYATKNSIKVIDLDIEGEYKTTTLFKIDSISNLQINNEGDTLYFYSEIGNQKGLYKLSI